MKTNKNVNIGPAGNHIQDRSLSPQTLRSNARTLQRSDSTEHRSGNPSIHKSNNPSAGVCTASVPGTFHANSVPPATYNEAPRPSCSVPPFAEASINQLAQNEDMEQQTTLESDLSTINYPQSTAFRLQKGHGVWELTHGSQRAILKHEIGLDYVSFLMAHPGEQFHGLKLALKVRATREGAPDREDMIQERALALDDAEASRRLYRKQRELESLIDDEHTIEAVRDEAYEQLKDILAFQKKNIAKTSTQASRASHAVGMAIKRLHKRLANAIDETGKPYSILRAFARHIRDHILIPSGRTLIHGGSRIQGGGGYFTHETDQVAASD